jgi:hypothetical protein
MLPITLRLLAAAVAVLAVAATPAAAVTTYRATISGTYTTTGTVTSDRCEAGPLTGDASETARFRTTRPAKVFVQRLASSYPAVALVDDHRPLRATATVTRTSGLDRGDTPRGCDAPPKAQDCGTRTLAFDVGFGTRGGGVAPDLSKNGFGRPGLFRACALTVGMFPTFADGGGSARVAAKRLLAGRRLVLRGGRRGSERESGGGIESSGSFDLRYTITLTPSR